MVKRHIIKQYGQKLLIHLRKHSDKTNLPKPIVDLRKFERFLRLNISVINYPYVHF